MRRIGTVSRGIRLPIVVQGDDIVKIVVDQVLEASQSSYEPFEIRNKDIVGITESLVARAQGNYVTPADIAEDVRRDAILEEKDIIGNQSFLRDKVHMEEKLWVSLRHDFYRFLASIL